MDQGILSVQDRRRPADYHHELLRADPGCANAGAGALPGEYHPDLPGGSRSELQHQDRSSGGAPAGTGPGDGSESGNRGSGGTGVGPESEDVLGPPLAHLEAVASSIVSAAASSCHNQKTGFWQLGISQWEF